MITGASFAPLTVTSTRREVLMPTESTARTKKLSTTLSLCASACAAAPGV
jgi:hypothetical protein